MKIEDYLDGQWPDDLTLQEATDALLNGSMMKGLAALASKRLLRIRWGWRRITRSRNLAYIHEEEQFPDPETTTLAAWRNAPEGWEPFIVVDEGDGGLKAPSPEPELVD